MRASRTCLASCLALVASLVGCDVYDPSLLTGGSGEGGAGNGGAPSTGGQGGEGGTVTCQTPDECPGADTECGTRVCEGGKCGFANVASEGTAVAEQTPGDCIRSECDGNGHVIGVPDDADLPVDNVDCTGDLCAEGVPSNPIVEGPCNDGGVVCNALGNCVACIDGSTCTSGICTESFMCASASCSDTTQNNMETDLNCGGPNCPGCAVGQSCLIDGDCLSNACSDGFLCEASCTDGILNQTESDVDCGGPCVDCTFGQDCNLNGDCETGNCGGGGTCTCAPNNGVLLISEVRSRGPAGAGDDFVELYNPGTTSVTLSSAWTIESRSESAASYDVRFTGGGQVVPPNRHFLVASGPYSGAATPDAALVSGIADEVSVVLKNGTNVVDAVCYQCGTNNFSSHTCEGTAVTIVGCSNNVSRSVERLPGGGFGNCVDTDDNAADFVELTPSSPQNLASPATP